MPVLDCGGVADKTPILGVLHARELQAPPAEVPRHRRPAAAMHPLYSIRHYRRSTKSQVVAFTNSHIKKVRKMKFEDITFSQRSRSGKSGLGLVLPGGYWVLKIVFEVAWSAVRPRWSTLDWRVPQTAETLCSDQIWKPRTCGERIALGRCVKYFVTQEMLPLRVANPNKKGKRKYVRK
jgi:hypothetical protein